ncbi:LysR substrate-binding domain-containing protein [Neotabrizicola shimadae]|uniref:LysR family transcriptional regulator n=1 Tax=Neotabrizicola shimadae TaxID=2807096 RepID=A0A8G0ZT98_9RHOB|nr:LysR substrate-binding domain-containing protein [Neotabrizicola shimadae]QYZ68288.1 LysR family transcriptional regulator [Neotabrizicola shimadae]
MHPAIKLRHIRLFLAVADLGSLTAAGRAEGISQPAVSASLAELETLLGAPLLTRQGRRIALTPQGDGFRRHAREALAALEAAARATLPEAGPQRLSVGLLPTVSTRFFPEVVGRFLATRPGVTLSIETGAHPDLLRKLKDRRIDLMIGRMPQAAELPGLDFEFLYEEPVVAAVRSGHPGADLPIITALRDHPVVLPTRDAIIRKTVDDYLAQHGLATLVPAVETSTLALGRGLLMATDAIWFISQGVIEAELHAGTVRTLPLGAAYLSGAVGMTRPAGLSPPDSLARLMQLIRDAAEARRSGA